MKKIFGDNKLPLELLDGTYCTVYDENHDKISYYVCVGKYNTNRILLYYLDTTGINIDYVATTINNIPKIAFDYLTKVLNTQENVLVHMAGVHGSITVYDIYYDCNYTENDIDGLLAWMQSNNDFSCDNYNYTEVKQGKQQYIKEG